jgi:SpoVK/Ycf46/Vps4 family AAA+-type ATPase
VEVFLRLIEYYGGILFLTTNRADEFDEAFQSRIHLSIGYHPLTPARRTAIWRNLLSDVQHEEWDETKWEKFGNEYEINGREIKNLIRTAVAIANFKKQALGEEHIRYVFDVNRKAQQAKLEMARLSAQTAS